MLIHMLIFYQPTTPKEFTMILQNIPSKTIIFTGKIKFYLKGLLRKLLKIARFLWNNFLKGHILMYASFKIFMHTYSMKDHLKKMFFSLLSQIWIKWKASFTSIKKVKYILLMIKTSFSNKMEWNIKTLKLENNIKKLKCHISSIANEFIFDHKSSAKLA